MASAAFLERLWWGRPLHTRPGAAEHERPHDSKVGAHTSTHTHANSNTLYTEYTSSVCSLWFLASLPASQSVLCAARPISWCFLPPPEWRRDGGISAGDRGKQAEDGGGRAPGEQRRERLRCSPEHHLHAQPPLLQPHRQGIITPKHWTCFLWV